jgi:hypothetical protein
MLSKFPAVVDCLAETSGENGPQQRDLRNILVTKIKNQTKDYQKLFDDPVSAKAMTFVEVRDVMLDTGAELAASKHSSGYVEVDVDMDTILGSAPLSSSEHLPSNSNTVTEGDEEAARSPPVSKKPGAQNAITMPNADDGPVFNAPASCVVSSLSSLSLHSGCGYKICLCVVCFCAGAG